MKKVFTLVAAALVSLALAGASLAADQVPAKKEPVKKPSVKKEQTITGTATVQAVDQTTRIVTLQGPKGEVFDLKAGEEWRTWHSSRPVTRSRLSITSRWRSK